MEADILTFAGILTPEDASFASCFPFDITISLMLGLHRIATNLGPIYELKNSEFLGLVSSR